MSDSIFLQGVRLYAHGGVTEAERETGRQYLIDITVDFDLERAGVTDELTDTVSYALLHDIAAGVMNDGRFNLVESRAERIASEILSRTAALSATVRIHKLAPPVAGVVAAAGVEITRRRRSEATPSDEPRKGGCRSSPLDPEGSASR